MKTSQVCSRILTLRERIELARLTLSPNDWRVLLDLNPTHIMLDDVGIPRDEYDADTFLKTNEINRDLNF
jgi:hypothetical protein